MGSRNFSAQYQQQPVPFDGNILKKEWIHRYDSRKCVCRQIIMSWDIATGVDAKNDYSVCSVWGRMEAKGYLIAVYRMRVSFPELIRKIKEVYGQHPQFSRTILIEESGPGKPLIQQLRAEGIYPVGITPEGDKVTRFAAVTPMFESGQVLIPENEPWLAEFEHELLSFPSVKHDDQVDSVSQFLQWHQRSWNNRIRVGKF